MAQEQKDTEQQGPVGFNGHRNFTMDELAALQPGLAIFMPMIGDRWWNVYYAAKEANWVMARFELGEAITLMQKGMQTRPRYTDALKAYIDDDLAPVEAALAAEDFEAFEAAFNKATVRANDYHEEFRKGYLVWKLPDHPNPQLDFTPKLAVGATLVGRAQPAFVVPAKAGTPTCGAHPLRRGGSRTARPAARRDPPEP